MGAADIWFTPVACGVPQHAPALTPKMSTLVLMVGGCGNYLGSELFAALHTELQRAASVGDNTIVDSLSRRFFTSDTPSVYGSFLKARGLLVDMEAKTVQNCLLRHPLPNNRRGKGNCYVGGAIPKFGTCQKEGDWFWDPKFAYWQQGGCGNNWALGHEIQGPSNRDNMERLLLSLAEEGDSVSSVMVLHSLAGERQTPSSSIQRLACPQYIVPLRADAKC